MRGQVALGHLLFLLLSLILYSSAQSTTESPKPESTKPTDALKVNTTKAPEVTKLEGPRGTKCVISQQGGNIKVYRDVTKTEANKTLTRSTIDINVGFLQLKELNENGTQVVDNTNQTHVISSFSDLPFMCGNQYNTTVADSADVRADCIFCWTNFKEAMFAKATFKITVCMVKDNGTITQMTEVSNVTAGQLKFNVAISKGWPWCDGDCKNGRGEFMDMEIGIKLPPGADKLVSKTVTMQDKARPTRFDLGSGAMIEFSRVAQIDGVLKNLTQNTPTMIQRDGANVVTLRFPRFAELKYDPTVETGDRIFEGMAGSSTPKAPLAVSFIILSALVALVNPGIFY